MTRVVFSRALCIVVNPLLGSVSLEAEVDLVLRRVHVFLEVLFPNLRPRAAEHVGYFELNRFAGRHLRREAVEDRKSTRLNSSHLGISYAVFCLKKKTKKPSFSN